MQRIIKIIRDVDFGVLKDSTDITDLYFTSKTFSPSDSVEIEIETKHGTVIYVAGMVEGSEDSIICMGAEEGSHEYKIAFYKDYLKFKEKWNELNGIKEG